MWCGCDWYFTLFHSFFFLFSFFTFLSFLFSLCFFSPIIFTTSFSFFSFFLLLFLTFLLIFSYSFLDLGEIRVYGQRGQRQPVEAWKAGYKEDSVVQRFTVTILTMLDQRFPLIYNIVQGSSNGGTFLFSFLFFSFFI